MSGGTRERILDAAVAIANQDGLGALSVRAVARRLELSPGNVSYHFSRKLDLILGISERLSAGNAAQLSDAPPASLDELLERLRPMFRRQWEFRGLILSAAHSMESYPELRARYRRVERTRRGALYRFLIALREAGQLDAGDAAIERLSMHMSLTARSWLSDYRMVHYRVSVDRALDHYLGLIADLFFPHATAAGRAALAPYLDGLLAPTASPPRASGPAHPA